MRWIDDFEDTFRPWLKNMPIACLFLITVSSIYWQEFNSENTTMSALALLFGNISGWGIISCVYAFVWCVKYHYPPACKWSVFALGIYALLNAMYAASVMVGADFELEHFQFIELLAMSILTSFCSLMYIHAFNQLFDKFIKWTRLK